MLPAEVDRMSADAEVVVVAKSAPAMNRQASKDFPGFQDLPRFQDFSCIGCSSSG
jgi:hypothetical protein